jgi:DDE superfamily endonuclease
MNQKGNNTKNTSIATNKYNNALIKNDSVAIATSTNITITAATIIISMTVIATIAAVKSVLPVRKKRKSELSDGEKRHNRKHSKLRVVVEHTVSRIKKFGIMGTKFRNRLRRYDNVSSIVSGIVNFRIMRTNGMMLL